MGTRSIILVTGKHEHGTEGQTARLYRHWDGDPITQLGTILAAIKRCKSILAHVQSYKPTAGEKDMPTATMADAICGESLSWGGNAVRYDDRDDVDTNGAGRRAIWSEVLTEAHYGNQGDLEWVYVVNIHAQTIRVYSNGYGTPAEHMAQGPVDPRTYADCLIETYQTEARSQVSVVMDEIQDNGWVVNPIPEKNAFPGKVKKTAKRKVTTNV